MRGDFRVFTRPSGGIVVNNIVSNVRHQIEPSGKALKKNAPLTIKQKMRYGRGNLSLIDKMRLFISKSTYTIKAGKKRVLITIKPVRSKIARILQRHGYIFFKIGTVARRLVFEKWKLIIRRGLR